MEQQNWIRGEEVETKGRRKRLFPQFQHCTASLQILSNCVNFNNNTNKEANKKYFEDNFKLKRNRYWTK